METKTEAKTLRDIALASVAADLREPLLAYSAEHGITHANDPFWPIASAIANGLAAAKAAGESARKVSEQTIKIPEAIYLGTMQASKELTAQVARAGESIANDFQAQGINLGKAIVIAIDEAAKTGAATITKAAHGLDGAAKERLANLQEESKIAFAKALEAQARSSFAKRVIQMWGTIASALVLSFALGGAVTIAVLSRSAPFVRPPPGWRIVHTNGWDELFVTQPAQPVPGCAFGQTCLAFRREQ